MAALTYNWGVLLKQLSSLPAFMFDMPIHKFVQYEAKALTDWKGLYEMWDNVFTQERFKGGFSRDVMEALSEASKLTGRSRIEWLIQQGMLAGRIGDIIPVVMGGYAIYHHTYDTEIQRGASPADAKAEAQIVFEMAVERAQQAGDAKDTSHYQTQGSAYRLFTMFTTSMRQYYANTWDSAVDFKAGHPGAGKDFAKRILISHILLPFSFQFITDVVRNVGNLSDDDDETGLLDINPVDYARAALMGPANGLFMIGHGITAGLGMGLNGIVKMINEVLPEEEQLTKTDVWGYQSPPVEWIADFGKGVEQSIKGAVAAKEDPSVDDFVEVIDGIGKSTKMFGGKYMSYEIGARLMRSTGLTDDAMDAIRPDRDKAFDEIKAAKKRIYALDADELKAAKKAKRGGDARAIEKNRYNELAESIINTLKPLSNEEIGDVLKELEGSTIPQVEVLKKRVLPKLDFVPQTK